MLPYNNMDSYHVSHEERCRYHRLVRSDRLQTGITLDTVSLVVHFATTLTLTLEYIQIMPNTDALQL